MSRKKTLPERDDPPGEQPEDTDEVLADHPELAPDEGRNSVEREQAPGAEDIRRRANTRDVVEEAGDTQRKIELDFTRNQDFLGDEASLPADADYTRGSGYLGSQLVDEVDSARPLPGVDTDKGNIRGFYESVEGVKPENLANKGFEPDARQMRDRDAALREGAALGPSDPERVRLLETMGGDRRSQGHDFGTRLQVTGVQKFGRDVGAQGLSQKVAEGRSIRPGSMSREHRDWVAVLGRLGGSSPGSDENLLLSEKFHAVQFPSRREEVLRRLEAKAEFRVRGGIVVDLRHAVEACRMDLFRNLNDLIDCVKDELRRMETVEHPKD